MLNQEQQHEEIHTILTIAALAPLYFAWLDGVCAMLSILCFLITKVRMYPQPESDTIATTCD